eukprot:486588-Pyramimonas_sp.AAC.1
MCPGGFRPLGIPCQVRAVAIPIAQLQDKVYVLTPGYGVHWIRHALWRGQTLEDSLSYEGGGGTRGRSSRPSRPSL